MFKVTMYLIYVTYIFTFILLLHIDVVKIKALGTRVVLGRNKFSSRHIIMVCISLQLIYFLWLITKYRNNYELNISDLDMILFSLSSIAIIALDASKVMRKNSINRNGLIVNTDVLKWSNVLSFHWNEADEKNEYTLQLVVKYRLLYKTFVRKANFRIESDMKVAVQEILDIHQAPRKQG